MRITLGCGLFEAGLAACITSFCLAPIGSFSQFTNQEPNAALADPSLQRMQRQQQALFEAVERIQRDSEMALNLYTDSVLTQFNLLQESFAAEQARDLAGLEQLNRFTRNVVVVMVLGMVLSMLIIAWIPLWATSRMTKQIVELGRLRYLPASPEMPAVSQLGSALERLDQRLLALETAPPRARDASVPDGAVAPRQATPRVAVAVGDSSALVFLPHESGPSRWAAVRRPLLNLRRLWSRA